MGKKQPWERQQGETAQAFAAFCVYRDMGPDRSIVKAVKQMGRKPGYKTVCEKWSRQHRWVDRAYAWEVEKDRITRETELNELKDMRRRHLTQAMALQGKAAQRLQALHSEELTPYLALAYIQEGTKLERLARGEPESIIEERRKLDDRDREIVAKLATDPNFMAAIQHAVAQGEAEADPPGSTGPVDSRDNPGAAMGEAEGDRPGDYTAPAGSGGQLQ